MYRALETEIERNLDIAQSTADIIAEERDMLQGDVKQRLVLHAFHTDVWDMLVRSGDLTEIPSLHTVTSCYEQLKEVNELVERFNTDGDSIVHSPLIRRNGNRYGRAHIIDIVRERCEEARTQLQEAYRVIEDRLDRTCPHCDTLFEGVEGLEQHIQTEHAGTE